jgi:hypothetical protein
MRKAVEVFKRAFLIFGVIVALTPCGICKSSSQAANSQMKSCEMGQMGGMKCCQSSKSKSQSPLCKTMDQSSEASTSNGSDLVAVPVISVVSADVFFLVKDVASPSFISSAYVSPPGRSLTLRI